MKKRAFALFMVCMMLISLIPAAYADETVVVTSPFTAAIAQVRSSVLGVKNYQMVSYSNNNNYGNYFGFPYGFGFGFGNDCGFGNYGRQNPKQEPQEVHYGSGSGVVVADKYVLTNYHVVEDASRVTVYSASDDTGEVTELNAVVVDSDADLDIAMLYVEELDVAPVTLGDSDTLQLGDWAICIGNPLRDLFYGTCTAGIISGLNRTVSESSYDKYGRKETKTVNLIQTDAAINSGNSGGGMFSVTGELMGIPERKYSGATSSGADIDGIGMCIPINLAKPMIEKVVENRLTASAAGEGKAEEAKAEPTPATNNTLVGKPRMGVTITSNPFTSVIMSGVYVSVVEDNGPAARSGMQAGDIIVEVNGEIITSVNQIQTILSNGKEGDTLKLKVYRIPGVTELKAGDKIPDGEYYDLEVTLAVVDQVIQ